MQIQRSFKGDKAIGTLFLVPTPIGNRDDMSYRMIQTLKEVDPDRQQKIHAIQDSCSSILRLRHHKLASMSTMLWKKSLIC